MCPDEPQISISEFKATCLKVLAEVKRTGQSVTVTKRGKPIAQILPPPLPKKASSWLGCFADTGEIKGDIMAPAIDSEEWEALR